jgi:hypothetical protein
MEELIQLRHLVQGGRYADALALIDEMEEMSRDDKINKITSFMEILLIHSIKQAVEQRSTRSWEVSIRNAARQINRINKRRKAGDWYLGDDDLHQALSDAYPSAIDSASLEALEGTLSSRDLAARVEREAVLEAAWRRIAEERAA